jgi:hypothetical protein
MALKKTKRKGFNFLRSYFDVFNELDNDADRLSFLTSIVNKQFLNEDPKDLNFIVNLCYESQRHQIETSVKGWERATNDTLQNASPTTPPTPKGLHPKEVEEKEEEEEEEKGKVEENVATQIFSYKKSLYSLVINKSIVDEWLKVRKAKKAVNTETALNGFLNQVDKTSMTVEQVLTICVERSWSGFKPEWIDDNKPVKQSSDEKRNDEIERLLSTPRRIRG